MNENLDLIKTYKIDTDTAFIYKNENNSSHEGQYTDVEEISNEEDDFEEER